MTTWCWSTSVNSDPERRWLTSRPRCRVSVDADGGEERVWEKRWAQPRRFADWCWVTIKQPLSRGFERKYRVTGGFNKQWEDYSGIGIHALQGARPENMLVVKLYRGKNKEAKSIILSSVFWPLFYFFFLYLSWNKTGGERFKYFQHCKATSYRLTFKIRYNMFR